MAVLNFGDRCSSHLSGYSQSRLTQKLSQLRHVGRNPPRLIRKLVRAVYERALEADILSHCAGSTIERNSPPA